MKSFRHICLAIALIAAFSLPVLADGGETQGPSGEITTPGAPGEGHTPGAPGDSHTPGAPIPGEISTPGLSAAGDPDSSIWTAALLALPGLLF